MNSKWTSKIPFSKTHGCPCVADCEKRCVGCRSTCEPFIEYEKKRLERDAKQRYDPYKSSDVTASCYYKPITESTFRVKKVNDRIRKQKSRGYLV